MKQKFYLFVSLCIFYSITYAQIAKKEIEANPHLSASNYYAYPDADLPKLTPAPKGYKPVYINHYGRHGSRWLASAIQYDFAVAQLSIAERNHALTALGRETLHILQDIQNESNGRLGDLTDVGADQHRRIARRMYNNFPNVFKDTSWVDARSTIVVRCILSMENELQELKSLNPRLKISHDASKADMWYMNYQDSLMIRLRKEINPTLKSMTNSRIKPTRFVSQLINDTKLIADSIESKDLMKRIFDLASNMQSHYGKPSLYNLFTQEELYALWEATNITWYVNYGPSALTGGHAPYSQTNLLKDFLKTADQALASNQHGATLRFGHEICVLPLVCLLELNNSAIRVEDLTTLSEQWQGYKFYPMGCNVQMIFYRKKNNDDILVKVLLNEQEAELPIGSDLKPYYHWKDVKDFYQQKLSRNNKME